MNCGNETKTKKMIVAVNAINVEVLNFFRLFYAIA